MQDETEGLIRRSGEPSEIIMVIDRSGSMGAGLEAMNSAIAAFIEEQKGIGEKGARLRVVHFDDVIEERYSGLLADAPSLAIEPRGMTALLDAIGRTLGPVDWKQDRRRVVVIVTDGMENASKEWDADRVRELLTSIDGHENVAVTYLGANQDAIAVAGGLGINANSAMTYAYNDRAIGSTIRSASAQTNAFRTGQSNAVAYSVEDREKAMEE